MIQQPDLFSFHNTIHLEGEALDSAEKSANKQEERVMQIFHLTKARMTPIAAHKVYEFYYGETPVTSIRRAITNLTKQGKLKRGEMKLEKYGKPNYQWELR